MSPLELLGPWRLERTVVDRTDGMVRAVSGTTILTLRAEGIVDWSESGTMTWSGGSVQVSRTLTIEREPESERDDGADAWTVRFADGRDFHPWRPGVEVVHDCTPDTYRGFVTGTPDGWDVVWEATGPAKDYRMASRLTRP